MSSGNNSNTNSTLTPEWMRVSKAAPQHQPARGPQHISELNFADAEENHMPEAPAYFSSFDWDMAAMQQMAVSQGYSTQEQRAPANPKVASTFKDHLNIATSPLTGDISLSDMLAGPSEQLSMLALGAKPTQESQKPTQIENRTSQLDALRQRIKLGGFQKNKVEQTHDQTVSGHRDFQEAEAMLGQEEIQQELNSFRRTTAKEGRRIAATAHGQVEIRKAEKRRRDREQAAQKRLVEPTSAPTRGIIQNHNKRASMSEIGKNVQVGSN